MTGHPDPAEASLAMTLRAWLHDSAEALPDDPSVFAAVRARLPDPRPRGIRHAVLAWTGTKRTITASAVLGVALIVVLAALPRIDKGTDHATSGPDVPRSVAGMDGLLEAGAYIVPPDAIAIDDRYEVTVTVPDGWTSLDGATFHKDGSGPPDGAALSFWAVDEINIDPCHGVTGDTTDRRPWYSLDWFAESLTGWWMPGDPDQTGQPRWWPADTAPRAKPPVAIEADGLAGYQVGFDVPDGIDFSACEGGRYVYWRDPDGGERRSQGPGQQELVRIIGVDWIDYDDWKRGFPSTHAAR